jgi:hypothetical protein
MTKLGSEEARELAEHFYRVSKALGDYRFANWDTLGKTERLSIEAMEWSLLNASSDFTALAVDVSLDDAAPVVKSVANATRAMKTAIKRAERVDKVLSIATAAVKLTGAILSGSPSAIAAALDRALKSAS